MSYLIPLSIEDLLTEDKYKATVFDELVSVSPARQTGSSSEERKDCLEKKLAMVRGPDLVLVLLLLFQSVSYTISGTGGCVKVPDMCYKLISDNYTHMHLPNMLNHTRREDVAGDIALWYRLFHSKQCNAGNQLKYFLCFTYAPVCVDNKATNKLIPPCKSMCQSVRQACEPVMRKHNYSWPSVFNCNLKHRFLDDASHMCINMGILAKPRGKSARRTSQSQRCSCKKDYKHHNLKSLSCKAHFVIRAVLLNIPKTWSTQNEIRVKVVRAIKPSSKTSKPRLFKPKSMIKMNVSNRRPCRCRRLKVKAQKSQKRKRKGHRDENYLVIGRNVRGVLHVDAITKWKDGYKQSLRKNKQC